MIDDGNVDDRLIKIDDKFFVSMSVRRVPTQNVCIQILKFNKHLSL